MKPQPGNSCPLPQPSRARIANKRAKALKITAMAALLSGTAQAATISMTPSNAPPPVLGSISISNLFNPYYSPAHGSDFGSGSNVGSGGSGGGSDGTYAYIANNKAVVGQTFRTGANPNGYKIVAVTIRAVAYGSTFSWVPSMEYAVRVTKPGTNGNNVVNGTNTLTVLSFETAEVGVDWANCPTCNVPGIDSGAAKGSGCGRYMTFTLGTPVALLPNTLYGFDIGLNTDTNTVKPQTFYWEVDGRAYSPQTGYPAVDLYTNGNAYGSGPWDGNAVGGHGDNTMTNIAGDRCFIVALTPGDVVTPPRITTQIRAGGLVVTNQPGSGTFYSGLTAKYFAKAAGDTNLVYQWQMNGTNISDGAKFSGTLTDTLSISNVGAADWGSSFTLVVTNSAGAVTTAPPAVLTVVSPPTAGTYAYAVYTNRAIAHWRLNETVNPATNPPTFDNMGGGVGAWETNALQASGPRPSAFNGFETSNTGTQSRTNAAVLDHSWTTFAPLHLKTNSATFTAWIFPNGNQSDFAGLFFTRAGSTEAGMQYGDSSTSPSGSGQLAYTWNNGAGDDRSWPSGFTIPPNQWTFIGLVITPTNGTVYWGTGGGALGSAVHSVPEVTETFDGPWTAGYDPRFAGTPQYVFNGVVDELAVWDRSLSFKEMTNLYAAAYVTASGGSSATAVVSGSTNICNGSPATISAALTGSSPWNVTWSDSITQNGVTTSPATRSVSPSTTTTYSVTALSDANGAAPPANLSGSAVVTVNVRPSSAVSGSTNICSGSAATISAALTGTGPWNVSWSDGSNQNAVATSPAIRSVSPSTTTIYTVTALTDANCAAQASDRTGSAVVTINVRPTSAVSGSTNICSGSAATISAALTGTGPWNVSWSDGSNQNAVAASPAIRSVSPSTTTIYTVTALTDANCAAQAGDRTGSAVVTVNVRPTSAVSGTANICNGSSATISAALTGTGPWNVSWSDGSNQNAVATSPATRSVSPSTNTTYTVTALSDANCTAKSGDLTGSAVVTVDVCLAPVTITAISGTTISYTGGAGSKFILLKSADISAARGSWSREATNTVTPGSFSIPAVGTGSPVFYTVKSE